jgi:hypothetical protein
MRLSLRTGSKPDISQCNHHSALSPIATAKADFRAMPCLLYPRKRTCAVQLGMSAMGHKRTSAALFDDFIDLGEYRRRECQAKHLRRSQIERCLKFCRLLDRQIRRLRTFDDLVDIECGPLVKDRPVG